MTLVKFASSLREWLRRAWGAVTGRRTDHDLQRELAAHVAFAEDELLRQGRAPAEAARLARAAAGGRLQTLEALRDQRGLPWLGSSWLDVRLGFRLLARNWGLTVVGGIATTLAIAIAAVVFTAFDIVMRSPLPLDEGERVIAIQVWDREAGRRRDTTWENFDRWRASLRSIDEIAAFQAIRRNLIAADGSIELANVAEMSGAAFRVARVAPLLGRSLVDADAVPGAAPVVVIGYCVWQRRFGSAPDVIGRELRLDNNLHTIVGVMPDGYQFPLNFEYWVPLRRGNARVLRDTGPEGVVFGRLAADASITRAHAEVSAMGILPPASTGGKALGPRVVPYTFAFTGDFEPGAMGMLWSLSSLLLVLLLLPPCANIAILNYARTITRQQEFAARHALGGSRARIVWQLFIEALVLTAVAAGVALLILRAVLVLVAERLQTIPGGAPFWMTLDVSYRTVIFVAALALAGAVVSGLVPALQATGRVARLGAGALAGRTGVRLGATWTTLVIAQVALSVAALPLAAQLAWGTVRSGVVGPGFAAGEYASARMARALPDNPHRVLKERLLADAGVAGVSVASRPPGDEPWVLAEVEGVAAPPELLNGVVPGFRARLNQVDTAFFDLYQVPHLGGRRFRDGDGAATDAVIINRNFAETIAPGGNALGHRFRYLAGSGGEWPHGPRAGRWYEVVGVVGNLPVTTDARVAYHAAAPAEIERAHLQLRLRGNSTDLAEHLRAIVAGVDPTLHLDEIRTLSEIVGSPGTELEFAL